MLSFIEEAFHRLIDELSIEKTRYLYSSFNLKNRLTGLVGPRGVGKTTLLLQYIKNELLGEEKCIYFSADLIYFQNSTLLEFVRELHLVQGYQIIFIDEVHKYVGWNQELKNLYDAFPSLKIVFSGSSMLDLVQGSHDLSRRAKLYRMHGLSFREYLNFSQDMSLEPSSLEEILQNTTTALKKVKEIPRILPLFKEYLQRGYYPFVFEDPHSYYEKVSRVIEKAIFEDIASFYSLKTSNLHYMKRILSFLASIPPSELSINSLSKNLSLDHKTVEHYLSILTATGFVRAMTLYEGGSPGLRKPVKVLLNNTTLLHTLQQYIGEPLSVGMEREIFFAQSHLFEEQPLFYSKQGDYRTRNAIFEIGGKNKTFSQLKGIKEPAYLVKDDILHPLKGEIPLFLFGFLY